MELFSSLNSVLSLVYLAEQLKIERRHSRTSEELKESVADHSWRVALLAVLLAPGFDFEMNIEKALKIAVVHDLPEIFTGDTPYFLTEGNADAKAKKNQDELASMNKIRNLVGGELGKELFNLWQEYEEGETIEAKFIKALDKIEAQIQHNQANFKFWNEHDLACAMSRLNPYCDFSSFLKSVREIVQDKTSERLEQAKYGIYENVVAGDHV